MFEDLIELLRNVSQGNQEAIEKGGLQETIGNPEKAKLSATSLQADHYRECVRAGLHYSQKPKLAHAKTSKNLKPQTEVPKI